MNVKNGIKLKVTSRIPADFIALTEETTISAPTDMPDHSREYFALRTTTTTTTKNTRMKGYLRHESAHFLTRATCFCSRLRHTRGKRRRKRIRRH